MYDLLEHVYVDAVIQKRKNSNEHSALVNMVDRATMENVLIICDRGYESYNNLAHIQEKGGNFFLESKTRQPVSAQG